MLYFDQERLLKWPIGQDSHYVPLHASDLIQFLSQHPGIGDASVKEFSRLTDHILAIQHQLYRQQRSEMLYGYAPLDPDLGRMLASIPTSTQRDQLALEFRDHVAQALARANFRQMSQQEIEKAMRPVGAWGVRMRVNFELQEWMAVYTRGSAIGVRMVRHWRKWFRKRPQEVPVYSRLIVLFRPREGHPQKFDHRYVYLRMFKNVPERDIDMMLPGAGIQMSWLDHSRIVLPSLYTIAITVWRIMRNVFLLALFGVFKTVGVVILIILAIGYGIKNLFSFRSHMVRRYMLDMTQNLYYQSLDNNAGVLLQVAEEAEQQQSCEAILVYHAIITRENRQATRQQIDDACSCMLKEATGMEFQFNSDGALDNLLQMGIVQQLEHQWEAVPLADAIAHLGRCAETGYS